MEKRVVTGDVCVETQCIASLHNVGQNRNKWRLFGAWTETQCKRNVETQCIASLHDMGQNRNKWRPFGAGTET